MDNQIYNVIMVVTYWILSAFWICVVGLTLSYITWKPLYRGATEPKRIMYGFLVLAIIFLVDSLFWSLANTSRVGFMMPAVSALLYQSWLVALIKAVFLVAAITFWITVVRTYGQIEQRMEAVYFTQFADQIVDAIGVLSPKGVVVYWNEGAEKLYGQPRKRVLGMHIKDFLVPQRLHINIEEILYRIRDSQQADRFIAPRLRYDGTEIMVDVTISPFFHANGEFGGYFGIMRPAVAAASKIKPIPLRVIDEAAQQYKGAADVRNTGEIVRGLAEVIASEEKQYAKRQKLTGAIALILLLVSCILLSLTLLYDGHERYVFIASSLITLICEIWPVRVLIRNRRDSFRERALKRILEMPNVDIERLKLSLDIINTVGQNLHGDPESTSESTKLRNLKIL
jgi:PAS domain S-box-containing protein